MARWANKYVIGITGNIATGKSVVRQMLQHLGAYTIDADGLTHQAMSPGAPAYKPIVETFGQFILNADKTINRNMLANIVFSNPEALRKLEAITHPVVGQAIDTLIARAKQPIIVIEAIKLLEGDLGKSVNAIWVVDAKPQTQYTRLVGKRKLSPEDAKQRILGQPAQSEKLKVARVVINNDGNIEDTWKQVQSAFAQITKTPSAAPAVVPAPTPPKPVATPTPPVAKPAAPAVAAPPPSPAVAPVRAEDEIVSVPAVDTAGVTVKRGMPSNAEVIADYINKATGQNIGRMDVILIFGQKSYLVAYDANDALIGLVGWQVENLITRVDELYITASAESSKIIYALIRAIEDASRELQSEVSFVFLPANTAPATIAPFLDSGYEETSVKAIKIPAWREAVQESSTEGQQILTKKLRKDRVLKPI